MPGSGPISRCRKLVRLLSTAASPGAPSLSLVRDFIHDSMYNPSYGYFSSRSAPVGTLREPIHFGSLYGQVEYLCRVHEIYQELQVSWLTPVEIFQPHYGSAIGQYIVQHHSQPSLPQELWHHTQQQQADQQHAQQAGSQHAQQAQQQAQQPLRLYEIGGGTGTLARNILDWLRQHHPPLYATCSYTCIEISATLAHLQQQKVAVDGDHGSRFSVVQQDAAGAGAWGGASDESCYVIMMEVLDNLTHDRVWRPHAEAPWQQTMVESVSGAACTEAEQHAQQQLSQSQPPHQRLDETYREVLLPVADPLILRCLECLDCEDESVRGRGWGAGMLRGWMSSLIQGSEGEATFLPTGSLALLDTLHQLRPNHHLIAADFDQLPEVVIPARNAPLVATTAGGRTVDHATYLVPKGTADIFFPTDFALLRQLYLDAAQHAKHGQGGTVAAAAAQHMKTAVFMTRFADVAATRTQSGYNPLLEDYTNTAFFLGAAST